MFARMLIALAIAGVVACAAPEPPAPVRSQTERADLIEHGRALAETHCSSCHAVGEDGESRLAAAPPLRSLAERYPVLMLQEAFAEGVLVGHPAMPEFRFEPDEIDALVAYLESIQERRGG
jgi:mono/diheme cytochrome c family protein